MPNTDALLLVILIGMIVNLGFASLLLVPRWREIALGRGDATAFAADGGAMEAADRPVRSVGLFGPLTPTPVPSDPETGFDLPGSWARWLDDEDARVRRYHRSATVVLVEIEGLPTLVERLGGDTVGRIVPPVAQNLHRHARQSDRIARLAVGRFGIVLAETDEIQAINYVERIRSACDAWLAAGGVPTRLLIGWAEANHSRSMDAAVRAAEDRLNADRESASPAAIEAANDELPQDIRASA